MQRSDFKKGQIVYLLIRTGSNRARELIYQNPAAKNTKAIDLYIVEGIVKTVGPKYITVEETDESSYTYTAKFAVHLDFREETNFGGSNYQLFLSKQAAYDAVEYKNLCLAFESEFSLCFKGRNHTFTLQQLKKAAEILQITVD